MTFLVLMRVGEEGNEIIYNGFEFINTFKEQYFVIICRRRIFGGYCGRLLMTVLRIEVRVWWWRRRRRLLMFFCLKFCFYGLIAYR